MKTLLLTDIPPSSNLTAGIVTAQMCRFVPRGELAIFCVLNRHLRPEPYADLAEIPTYTVSKPNEFNRRNHKIFPLDLAKTIATEAFRRYAGPPSLIRQAIEYGRQQRATSLWAVLQGQTMVRIAGAVAEGLNVPLRAQVWDPLVWWLQAHGVDRFNRKIELAKFDETMRRAETCATASWAMAREYEQTYGVACHVVIASLDAALSRQPHPALRPGKELAIGMAGQFYAESEWNNLLLALNYAGWQVGGRKVVIRVAGHSQPQMQTASSANIEFLGWKPQAELVNLLSTTCDILYCPYPFSQQMEDVARLSFPSKIPTYLAAGRPILFHGPGYASPAHYLRDRGAGLLCRTGEPAAVYDALVHLVEDTDLYARLAMASHAAFLDDFTLNSMKKNVRSFLGYPD